MTKCPRDAHKCVTEGQPLHWDSPCLTYSVQLDGSARSALDADQVQGLAAEAFAIWQEAPCPGGGTPRFRTQFQGYVSCDRKNAVCGGADQNVNVIMLHDQGWPYRASDIGITTPSGGVVSGLVFDADVELNAQDYAFQVSDPDSTATSVRYVLAHELGHFLGLGHSDVDGALMSEGYQSVPRDVSLLSADDIAAICSAYPPGQPLTCAAPGAPAYDTCAPEPDPSECKIASVSHDASGCACRANPRGRPAPALLALGSLLACLAVRRRIEGRIVRRASRATRARL